MNTYTKRSVAKVILCSGLIQGCQSFTGRVPELPASQEQVTSVCTAVPFEEPCVATVIKALDKATSTFTINESPDHRAELVQALRQLAILHQEQGEASAELRHYTDAATCYQYVLSLCSVEQASTDGEDQIVAAYSSLAKLRRLLAVNVGDICVSKLRREIDNDKQQLQALRQYAKERTDNLEGLLNQNSTVSQVQVNEVAYIRCSQGLFRDIATRIKSFLARLYRESEQEIGPPPSRYTVMGLGFMALQQMTPYSELEFAILTDESSDPVATRAYLKQLTHLVNFRVINLGETIIPRGKYGIDLQHLAKRGIRLDVDGKTPLGSQDKPYTLIQTVAGMLQYLRNEGNQVERMDKNLAYILESTCYVCGDEELYKSYETQKIQFLGGSLIYKSRGIRRMLEGALAWDYPRRDVVEPRQKYFGDLADLILESSVEDQDILYDVEKEIYRLSDSLLYGLAFYHGIVPSSGWDAVSQLFERGMICVEALHNLCYIMSFANMLRLRTYLHYGQQYACVTMLGGLRQEEAQEKVRKALCLPQEALQTDSNLFKYYYIAIPLHLKMGSFFDQLDVRRQWMRAYAEGSLELQRLIEEWLGRHVLSATVGSSFFLNDSFYDNGAQAKADVHLRLLQRTEAIVHLEEVLKAKQKLYGPKHPYVAAVLNKLGNVHRSLKHYAQSITYYTAALAIKHEVYGSSHTAVATTLNNLGTVHNDLGEYTQSLTYYKEALVIMQEVYGFKHRHVASMLNNLGVVHSLLGDHEKSLSFHREALTMKQTVYGSQHPFVGATLNNLGDVYNALGEHDQSLACYQEALGIMRKVYGAKYLDVATALNGLGAVHSALGDYAQSLTYYKEALAVMQEVCGAKHLDVTDILHNLGDVYNGLGEHVQSITYLTEALAIRQAAYGDIPHPDVASTLHSLGSVYKAMGEYVKSIQCYEECLDIEKRLDGDTHERVAITLADLGNVHNVVEEYAKSIVCYEEALQISRQVHDELDPSIAQILHNLGNVYRDAGDLTKGLACHREASQIYKLLGANSQYCNEYAQSAEYFEQALVVGKQIHGDIHPDIAALLYALATAYYLSDQLQKSIRCYEDTLSMCQQLGEGNSEPTYATTCASIAHNLACMYHTAARSAMQKGQDQSQEYLMKSKDTFELAIAAKNPPTASLCTEYANFLLVTEQYKAAYPYLQQAITIGDDQSGLGYSKFEKQAVASVLQEKIDQVQQQVLLRSVDYAYYLLIHHYKDFQAVGIHLAKAREAYLEDYRQAVHQRPSQVGKEQEDAMARYLLERLGHEMGYQLAAA